MTLSHQWDLGSTDKLNLPQLHQRTVAAQAVVMSQHLLEDMDLHMVFKIICSLFDVAIHQCNQSIKGHDMQSKYQGTRCRAPQTHPTTQTLTLIKIFSLFSSEHFLKL